MLRDGADQLSFDRNYYHIVLYFTIIPAFM
jgi:hypothetical protein